MKSFDKEFKEKSQGFIMWSVDFSKRLIVILTVLFAMVIISSMLLPCIGATPSEVLIKNMTDTFKVIVGMYLVKSTLENVFRYNDLCFSHPNGEYCLKGVNHDRKKDKGK